MVLTELIDEMITLTIYSAYVKNEKPISLLLVASPEAGKTKIVQRFADNQCLVYLSDATAKGLIDAYQQRLKMGAIKHFVFTDLITPLSKNVDTRSSFISFFNGLIEEGLMNMHTYVTHVDIEKLFKPVGVIGCITPEPLQDNRRHWKNIGFMSRVIPFSWSYSEKTIEIINDSIKYEQYAEDKPIQLDLPKRKLADGSLEPDYFFEADIKLEPELSGRLTGIAEILAERVIKNPYTGQLEENKQARKDKDNPYGFRLTRQLHVLAKASALRAKREKVNAEDIDKIISLSNWMNFKCLEM